MTTIYITLNKNLIILIIFSKIFHIIRYDKTFFFSFIKFINQFYFYYMKKAKLVQKIRKEKEEATWFLKREIKLNVK